MTTTLPKLAELTAEQRQILCAEATGWRKREPFLNALGDIRQEWEKAGEITDDGCGGHGLSELPDPDEDAAAALALVATLTDPWEHIRFVQAVCESEKLDWEMCVDAISMPLTSIWALITLKPRTLTSGFLLAKGLAR